MLSELEFLFFCFSINHKNSPVEVRKRFAFSNDETKSFLDRLIPGYVSGSVIVSTCNRTEFYFSVRQSGKNGGILGITGNLEKMVCVEKGQDSGRFREFCFCYIGLDAVRHLFSVAGGLDSMILGENQILGQVRESYEFSKENGFTDFSVNFIFQHALGCAKRIKTETNLSKTTESIATLTVKEIMKQSGFRKVLMIGASGQTGSLIVKDLSERDNVHVYATVRKHYGLPELDNVEKIPYESRYDYLDGCDIIVSATKSPHYTVTLENVKKALKSEKKRLFLDLAVPNDMDPDIAGLEGCSLRNIDCFRQIAAEHNEMKKSGAVFAEEILEEELDSAVKEMIFHDSLDFFGKNQEKFTRKNGMQLLYSLRKVADARETKMLLGLCRRLFTDGEK